MPEKKLILFAPVVSMKKLFLSLFLLLPVMMAAQEASNKDDVVYLIAEHMPEFVGGQEALYKYVQENTVYPEDAKNRGIEGRAIFQVIVNKDSTISDVTLVKTSGNHELDMEARRVVEGMPKWKPALQQGKPVRAKYTIPINFTLSEKKEKKNQEVKKAEVKKAAPQPQAPQKKKMDEFTDGDSFRVLPAADSRPVLAQNGAMICPNQGYVNDMDYTQVCKLFAEIRMSEDTMFVTYYHFQESVLIKKERYLFNPATQNISLEGEQVYYQDRRVACIEYISKGRLRRVAWYDRNGKVERMYLCIGNNDFTELQFYPSGKTKVRTEHFGTPNAVQVAYDEAGNEVQLTPPQILPEDEHVLAGCIISELNKTQKYQDEDFHLSITLQPADSSADVSIYNAKSDSWKQINCRLNYSPALIDGTMVAYTLHKPFQYRPFRFLLPTPDDSIVMNVSEVTTKSRYIGTEWMKSRKYKLEGGVTASAIIHRNEDTLYLKCISQKDPSEITVQKTLFNLHGWFLPQGWAYQYKDGQLVYAELHQGDSIALTRKFYPDGSVRSQVVPQNKVSYVYKEKRDFYPTGELMLLETIDANDKSHATYYSKDGTPTKAVVLPTCPGGAKALVKYLNKNIVVSTFEHGISTSFSLDGWMDVYVEVDEHGRIIDVQPGASKLTTSINIGPWNFESVKEDMIKCLRSYPEPFTPGTIDGEPQTLRTRICLKGIRFAK